ncbi:ester cyclase [Oerskovia sp. Sa1BUA8]|uniref:Ester cyclase n=1 Tax=Oerskovia douganii TaxID=2762210 RepID=A0A9D5UC10_9CELL|nr:ester cyclase [Oerskovia douganii]MBE7702150.1 ester cyclase [Oerskovia douganii]
MSSSKHEATGATAPDGRHDATATTPVTATNKAAAIAVHTQAIPGNHAQALAALVAADFHNHDPAPGCSGGLEGLVAAMHWFSDAFSDQHVEVLHAVAEGDLVALHVAFSARHTGFFRGLAPTGRHFTVREMHMLRFVDGREAEHWAVRDDAWLVRELSEHAVVPTSAVVAATRPGAAVGSNVPVVA